MAKKFRYTARDASGRGTTGFLKAADEADALATLRNQGLNVMELNSVATSSVFGVGKVKEAEIMVFTRQFATMISSGIPVFECLSILQISTSDKNFAKVLGNITERVKSGGDLSDAMKEYPNAFSKIYVNMIAAGEASGQLEEILLRLADFIERSEKLKREIKSAMIYPVISLALVLGITWALLVFIVPKFRDIFDQVEMALPLPTVVVLGVSDVLRGYWWAMLIVFAGLFIAFKIYKATDAGEYNIHWLQLKLPVFGGLLSKVGLSRFARTFATLLRSGVPILNALDIVSGTVGNRVIENVVADASRGVSQGEPLASTLATSPVFPHMLVRMVEIGERSGALEQLLIKVADFYDEQVSASVEALTSVIEPVMVAIMGILVGGIVLAIFMPILKLQQSLSDQAG